MRPTRSGGCSSPRSRYTRMLRVVVRASRASSSIRYSPDASTPCGCTAASNNCDTADSTTSRELRRICLRIADIAPACCRGCLAAMSGRRRDGGPCVPRYRLVIPRSEVAHLSKILGGEPGVHRRVESVGGQVPTAAAAHPGRLRQPLLQLLVVAALNVGPHVEIPQVVLQDRGDARHG